MAQDPVLRAHLEWLGYVQPVGLVVSIPALQAAQAQVNRNIAPEHARFVALLPRDPHDELILTISDFPQFAREVLGWEPGDLRGAPGADPVPPELEVALPEYHEVLRPTYAVPEYQPADPAKPWLLLVKSLPEGTDFDRLPPESSYWQASPHLKFERLLRDLQAPIGLLFNGKALRLVYAPRGETSGYLTFSVAEMASVAGRPIFAALQMLLSAERLFSLPERQRLPAILADSRKYQNVVSTKLAEQVLAALYELVRGFQSANEQRHGDLLRQVLADDPNQVYGGLLTVLMRLVFVLFAEDRNLLSSDPVYTNFYSVTGLFERLRADQGRYPDTMHQRYGAWAQLVTLFRLLYEGGSHGGFRLPARQGYLFDPQRYPFLEGRGAGESSVQMPHVSDGVVYQVLQNLLILDGERLSYRTLDVEQIGSVYETTMGFSLEIAAGRSIAIKPKKRHGAPATINLEALLTAKPADRNKWLKERTDQEVTGQAIASLKEAQNVDDLLAALDRKLAKDVTPNVVAKGSMIFQPSDERRRSGSHYTPRSLTEPIVRTTLRPVLEQLGEKPTPEQILALKVCDPAMGSGAFLVEACRQLGDELVAAWHAHDCVPKLPPDEDEILHARRLVAQRCLYGVDRNALAVDLAKLSLWLATLAKDHPFTFLDHSLRCGDSLVGLSCEQIAAFHWAPKPQRHILQQELAAQIAKATEARRAILTAPESSPYADRQQQLAVAEEALDRVRRLGDLVIAAFFGADKPKAREQLLAEYLALAESARGARGDAVQVKRWLGLLRELRSGERPVTPFHWEMEFPEVFLGRDNRQCGFDAMVGNPPFAGHVTLATSNADRYPDWLRTITEGAAGKSDLVSFFFRRAFGLLRAGGCFGLIATNTIGQGDTRSTGLRWICTHGGVIYCARRRYKWPGAAAVVVSVVHIGKGSDAAHGMVEFPPPYQLDNRRVPSITAYLFHAGGNDDPARLVANEGKSFQGSIVLGMGFTFDDTSTDGVANPLSLMRELIAKDPKNAERIFPYIGGEEVNNSPTHAPHRYVISFDEMDAKECRIGWPELMTIVEAKVKPERMESAAKSMSSHGQRASIWWQHYHSAKELYAAIRGLDRVLVISRVGEKMGIAFVDATTVFADSVVVFPFSTYPPFAVLQSRPCPGSPGIGIWAAVVSESRAHPAG